MGGFSDITPGRAADGVAAIQMRAWHIMDTTVGGLPQDPDWGWGIADKIGVGLNPGDLKTEEHVGRAAFRRDPEIKDASVAIEEISLNRYRVTVHLETVRGPADIERDIGA
jgi:hypothetical protein